MDKFIVTADREDDIIALLKDCGGVYRKVNWDPGSVTRVDEHVDCSEIDMLLAYERGDLEKMDDYIMSGEVPVGGLVVVSDGSVTPLYGYVCGNGNNWYQIRLPKAIVDRVMSFYPPIKYGLKTPVGTKRFTSRKELEAFVENVYDQDSEGFNEDYISLRKQFDEGKNILEYGYA